MPYVLYKNGAFLRGNSSYSATTESLQEARVFSEKRFAENSKAFPNFTPVKVHLVITSSLEKETTLIKWLEENKLWKN